MRINANKQIVLNREDVVTSLQSTIESIATAVGFTNPNGTFIAPRAKIKTKTKHYNAGRLEELMGAMETFDLMLTKQHFSLYNRLVKLLKDA